MQMFGIGVLELLVILTIAVLVVGPERLPQLASDLARWIRTARAMGQRLTREFDDTWKEFEREAGTTREDWKEIQSVFMRNSRQVTGAIEKAVADVETAGDAANAPAAAPSNVIAFDSTSRGVAETPPAATAEPPPAAATQADAPEKPWFMPETPRRRLRRGE